MSTHVVAHLGAGTTARNAHVVGPLLLYSWRTEEWHEHRIKADAIGQYRITRTQVLSSLPGGTTELPYLVLAESLFWQESGPQPRYHQITVGPNQAGSQVLKDLRTIWALPGDHVAYSGGLALRGGLYIVGGDALYHKFVAKPRADGIVVLMEEKRATSPPF